MIREWLNRRRFKPEVGMVFVDKVWGDTLIQITAISNNGEEIRYKFIQIYNRKVISGLIHVTSVNYLKHAFDKVDNVPVA